jgi:hypothetical protein
LLNYTAMGSCEYCLAGLLLLEWYNRGILLTHWAVTRPIPPF